LDDIDWVFKEVGIKIILNWYDRFHAVGGVVLNKEGVLEFLRLLVFS